MTQPTSPSFADVLRSAFEASGLTLGQIQLALAAAGHHVSTATLSYWQSGRSRPRRTSSLEAVVILERVLGLSGGTLLETLDLERTARVLGRWPSLRMITMHLDTVAEALTTLGFTNDHFFHTCSTHDLLRIGAVGAESIQHTRLVIRATDDDVRRVPLFYHDTRADAGVPRLSAIQGCTLGTLIDLPDSRAVAGELVLRAPLRSGDCALLDIAVAWSAGSALVPDLSRTSQDARRVIAYDVTFPADETPREVSYRWRPTPVSPLRHQRSVPVINGRAQLVMVNAPMGEHGLFWG
jgi:hypothetical protein